MQISPEEEAKLAKKEKRKKESRVPTGTRRARTDLAGSPRAPDPFAQLRSEDGPADARAGHLCEKKSKIKLISNIIMIKLN